MNVHETTGEINNVLIITELTKEISKKLSKQVVEILSNLKEFAVFSECEQEVGGKLFCQNMVPKIDYIICIGQNKTSMRACRILSNYGPIPIVSISDGDEPIMASYSYCDIESLMKNFVEGVRKKSLKFIDTLQFDILEKECTFTKKSNFSCQLEIRRDMRKSVLKLKIYIKIQGQDFLHLGNVWGDGLIISTPFGSMGRNINLSGPLIYKSMESIILVPISPLSLKFRPIVLPATADILIQVDESSRSSAEVIADDETVFNELHPGKRIILTKSKRTSKLVSGLSDRSTQEQWVSCLREVLRWGQSYSSIQKIERISTIQQ